jgi:hypothetical protein
MALVAIATLAGWQVSLAARLPGPTPPRSLAIEAMDERIRPCLGK